MASGHQFDLPFSIELWDEAEKRVEELLEHIQRFSILRGIPKSGEQCESSVLLGMEGDYGAGLQPGFA
jgi:hypothetical protein